MTFEEWLKKSIYAVFTEEKEQDELLNVTVKEVIAVMEAAWHAGMKEQAKRDEYAYNQHHRITNRK